MEPAWVKTCGSNFRLTSRTIVQPNGGTREVPCYQLTKTECLYIAMSQRAWHRVMGRSSPFASLYSTSAKLRPLTFTHAGSILRMASITCLCCLPVSSAISSDVMVCCKLTISVSQRAWHRVTLVRVLFQFSDRWSEYYFNSPTVGMSVASHSYIRGGTCRRTS